MTQLYNIVIARAGARDAQEILELQKLAYLSEAKVMDDYTILPLHQTLEETLSESRRQVVLKVEHEERIVGSVRCCRFVETLKGYRQVDLGLTAITQQELVKNDRYMPSGRVEVLETYPLT